MNTGFSFNRLQLMMALLLLVAGLFFGYMGSLIYIFPSLSQKTAHFQILRPMHVTSVVLWIITCAQGLIHMISRSEQKGFSKLLWGIKVMLLFSGIVLMYSNYVSGNFGGREYWEFPWYVGMIFLLCWILDIIVFFKNGRELNFKYAYSWMWLTGMSFLVIIFIESYLYLILPLGRTSISDLTIQWKSNGSLVGAWNQMVYGLSLWLASELSGNRSLARGKMAFLLYFLGLFNLMFNWGHHIYTLPTIVPVRYISYVVSMTEWILLIRILRRSKIQKEAKNKEMNAARAFLVLADKWVMYNLTLALLMSIPAINLFTHGTWITVAHSMGTTIGINTFILFAVLFHVLSNEHGKEIQIHKKWVSLLNIALLIFLLMLFSAGVMRGIWQWKKAPAPFSQMMHSTRYIFYVFVLAGTLLIFGIYRIVFFSKMRSVFYWKKPD